MGLRDAVVSEMIKQLSLEKINTITKCFQERFMGQMEAPSSWKVVKLVFLLKLDAEPKKGIRSCKATALTSVFSSGTHLVLFFALSERGTRKLEETACGKIGWNKLQLSTPASDGNKYNSKTLGMARGQNSHVETWQCSVVRSTMYMASMDIKTAFDEARPRHVAKIMENHDTRDWLFAAMLTGLESKAMFECVESSFVFNRCLRQGSAEAPHFLQKVATQILATVEEGWIKKRTSRMKGHIKYAVQRDPIEAASRWDLVPTLRQDATNFTQRRSSKSWSMPRIGKENRTTPLKNEWNPRTKHTGRIF